jgi:hypothetical protein
LYLESVTSAEFKIGKGLTAKIKKDLGLN